METICLAVNGTLMRGLDLNRNLGDLGARFDREATTDAHYRLWSVDDRHPAMMRDRAGGREIHVELWKIPRAGLSVLLQKEPAGLCVGRIWLLDGSVVLGVLAEPWLCEGRREITEWGGWRAYTASLD